MPMFTTMYQSEGSGLPEWSVNEQILIDEMFPIIEKNEFGQKRA